MSLLHFGRKAATALLGCTMMLLLGGCPGRGPAGQGEKVVFPIGGYSGDPARDRAAGFTVAGPVYGIQRDGFLARCEAAGMPCFYTVGVDLDFLGKKGPEPKELDFDAIRKEITEQVSAVVGNPLIHCWYLTPEELRFWRPLELEYLKVASEAITAADPKKRPVWMYEPGHRVQAALEKTSPYLSLVGKGVYPNYSGKREERAWVPWTIGQQAAAVRAVNPGAEPYGILEMFKRPEEHFSDEEIHRWVRHDAYASLVGGVRGIMIFSFGGRAGFSPRSSTGPTSEWQAYYDAWSGVARDLNGPEALGSVFLAGKPMEPPAFRVVEGEARVPLSVKAETPVEVEAVSSAAFTWGGGEYWFVVNSSGQPVRLELERPVTGWKPLALSGQGGQPGQLGPGGSELRLGGLEVAVFRRHLP